ncbi:MAG: SDR family NAD(P)-dependent oxidoreductase [Firmicutes bacterium]|nr:SDR family NAD(P)-dependent oxidoreductase [Bacillota bacterium]
MKKDLFQKTVIITGASSGIGRATAVEFARAGAKVVLAARNEKSLAELAAEIAPYGREVLVVPTDVTQRPQVRRLVEEALARFGRIDIFVSNAGIYHRCPVRDLRVEDGERVMAVNFYGFLHGVQEVLPHMLARKEGHIVLVSSVDGKKGLPPDGAYVAAKFAATGLAEVLRQELHSTGVHVSTVLPGRVDTPLIADLSVPWISAKIPPERVAKAILKAVRKKKAEIVVPWLGPKTLLFLNTLSPRLGDWAVRVFRLEGRERSFV